MTVREYITEFALKIKFILYMLWALMVQGCKGNFSKAGKAAPVASPPASKAAVAKSTPAASSNSAPASLDVSLSPALTTHRALVQSIQKHDGQGEIHERYVSFPSL